MFWNRVCTSFLAVVSRREGRARASHLGRRAALRRLTVRVVRAARWRPPPLVGVMRATSRSRDVAIGVGLVGGGGLEVRSDAMQCDAMQCDAAPGAAMRARRIGSRQSTTGDPAQAGEGRRRVEAGGGEGGRVFFFRSPGGVCVAGSFFHFSSFFPSLFSSTFRCSLPSPTLLPPLGFVQPMSVLFCTG